MDDITKICDTYNVPSPTGLILKVTLYRPMSTISADIFSKNPKLRLTDALDAIGSLDEKITYLEALHDVMENRREGNHLEVIELKKFSEGRLVSLKVQRQLENNPEIKESDIRPIDKSEWIEEKRRELIDQFKTDDDWAKHVLKLFRKEFKTTNGSVTSMKSYGIYNR